ncbi:hypothetical protein OCF09_26805 [Bacillus cereus]|nr:hypothetical protein [Bacillus cereus]
MTANNAIIIENKIKTIVLYKKVDGVEIEVATFTNQKQAMTYSVTNRIMNSGWCRKSLETNTYPTPGHKTSKYPNTTDYRFAYKFHDLTDIL